MSAGTRCSESIDVITQNTHTRVQCMRKIHPGGRRRALEEGDNVHTRAMIWELQLPFYVSWIPNLRCVAQDCFARKITQRCYIFNVILLLPAHLPSAYLIFRYQAQLQLWTQTCRPSTTILRAQDENRLGRRVANSQTSAPLMIPGCTTSTFRHGFMDQAVDHHFH